mmetsp:Transcript_37088/g.56906  ORF Transcript_37088/g.56906 Transcript_37088/m.56906 type:complete len:211 (-) Transcript_37088:137-769(-)
MARYHPLKFLLAVGVVEVDLRGDPLVFSQLARPLPLALCRSILYTRNLTILVFEHCGRSLRAGVAAIHRLLNAHDAVLPVALNLPVLPLRVVSDLLLRLELLPGRLFLHEIFALLLGRAYNIMIRRILRRGRGELSPCLLLSNDDLWIIFELLLVRDLDALFSKRLFSICQQRNALGFVLLAGEEVQVLVLSNHRLRIAALAAERYAGLH